MATPNVAVIARLILKEMKKDKAEYTKILKSIQKDTETTAKGVTKATKSMTSSFDEFINKSKAMANALNLLSSQRSFQILQELGTAFQNLAKGAEVNIERFDELVRGGASFNDALKQSTVTVDSLAAAKEKLAQADKEWLTTLGQVTTAVAGVTTVLRTAKQAFDDAIETYSDLAEETRRITLQTGLATEEASIWAKTAEIQNVSARSLAAGFAQVSRNLTNMQLRMAAGQKDSTTFTRTIKALGIEVKDSQGNFKTTADIITEVNARVRELGPGWQAAGVTQNIYGRGAASLLPIILDQAVSIEEVTTLMTDMGAVMTDLDSEAFNNLREATARQNIANQAIANTISREYIPILVDLKNAWTAVLELLNRMDQVLRATSAGFRAITNPITDFVKEFQEVSKQVAGDESVPAFIRATFGPLRAFRLTLQKIKEEGLESQSVFEAYREELDRLNGVTEDAVNAESELTTERQAAIDALFAETENTDALNKNLKDQEKILRQLTDAWNDYQDRIVDINRRFNDQLEDADIRSGREQVTRGLKQGFALEDIHIKRAQRLRDLTIDLNSRQQKLQQDLTKKLENFQRDADRAREKIAVKHRENLLKIENRFSDTVEEAARTNDTVAVVRAIRQRSREQRDETRRFSVEQVELEKDLKIKRDKIQEDARTREAEEKQRADERRARIEQQFKDEVDALKRKNDRELVLSRKKDNERRDDIERNRAQALRDAEIFYEREKLELQTHLRELNVIAVLTTMNTTQAIARVAADAMASVAAITAGGVTGAATRAATEFIGGGLSNPSSTGLTIDQWLRGRTTGGHRAHGGLDVVNRPTTFTAGEAGAEIAAFIPLSNNRSMNHTFDKLPIDFGGLPGGMDTSQVEGIVYSAMIELARVLGKGRR